MESAAPVFRARQRFVIMDRRHFALGSMALLLSACGTRLTPRQVGTDGLPLPSVYEMPDDATVQFRALDSVNALRQAAGAPALRFSAELNAAAATHARDMAVQNRPWHFGSDGSSPIDRARRAGYAGTVLGENISGNLRDRDRDTYRLDGPTRDPRCDNRQRCARSGVCLVSGTDRQNLVGADDGRWRNQRASERAEGLTAFTDRCR